MTSLQRKVRDNQIIQPGTGTWLELLVSLMFSEEEETDDDGRVSNGQSTDNLTIQVLGYNKQVKTKAMNLGLLNEPLARKRNQTGLVLSPDCLNIDASPPVVLVLQSYGLQKQMVWYPCLCKFWRGRPRKFMTFSFLQVELIGIPAHNLKCFISYVILRS